MIVKTFYSLIVQDLPETLEDNLNVYMGVFLRYLVYSNPGLDSSSENEISELDDVKAGICRIVDLFITRYEEVFTLLPQFVQEIGTLLTQLKPEPKHDLV